MKAKRVSFWTICTLRDIASGEAAKRARQQKTPTIRVLHGQTLSACAYNGWAAFDGSEPYVTAAGEEILKLYEEHEGRYRMHPEREVSMTVYGYMVGKRKGHAA